MNLRCLCMSDIFDSLNTSLNPWSELALNYSSDILVKTVEYEHVFRMCRDLRIHLNEYELSKYELREYAFPANTSHEQASEADRPSHLAIHDSWYEFIYTIVK